MNDPGVVGGGQTLRNLLRDFDHALERHPSTNHLDPQGLAFDELGDQKMHVAVCADVVDRQDIWMIQRACGDRFLGESALTVGVAARPIVENLDRHCALQPGVAPAIHLSHAASTERADDLVGPEMRRQFRHSAVFLRAADERYPSGRGGVNVTERRMDGCYCAAAAAAAPYTRRDFAP